VKQLTLAATLDAIVPPISIELLLREAPALHRRLANPKRKRRQAVNYPNRPLS